MFRLLRLVVVVVVLGAAFYVGDRLAAHAAEHRIAAVVQADAHLETRPAITVRGFPFLTQAISGKYHDIEMTAHDIFDEGEPDAGTVLRLDFGNVRLPLSHALHGQVGSVMVGDVTGSALVPYTDLQKTAAAAGITGVSALGAAGQPGQVMFDETAVVAGRSVAAQVTAGVAFKGGSIVVSAVGVRLLSGQPIPPTVRSALLSHAAFPVALPGLPAGVEVTAVSVTPTGVSVALGAGALTLTR